MAEIKVGILQDIYMVGSSPYGEIAFKKKTEKLVLSKKALWALLRFHYGNNINKEISKKRVKKDFDFERFAIKKLKDVEQRKLQYILGYNRKDDDYVTSVASLKHSIKTKDMVYEIIEKTLKKKKIDIEEQKNMKGRIIYLKTVAKVVKVGVQIYAGDIYTHKAITIAPFVKITSCMNPLTWLGVKNTWFSRESVSSFKIKRLEKISYLEDRIPEILDQSLVISQKFLDSLERSKEIKLKNEEGKKILLTLCKSYGIGLKPINKVYKRWVKEEKKTLYGLAMATSYYASHGNIFRKKSKNAHQNISSISGAMLLIKNKKHTMKMIDKQFKDNEDLKNELKEIKIKA
jgi:hypothetical protein